nr:DUF533 domain-containing protein [Pseudothauera nasutitermitis]
MEEAALRTCLAHLGLDARKIATPGARRPAQRRRTPQGRPGLRALRRNPAAVAAAGRAVQPPRPALDTRAGNHAVRLSGSTARRLARRCFPRPRRSDPSPARNAGRLADGSLLGGPAATVRYTCPRRKRGNFRPRASRRRATRPTQHGDARMTPEHTRALLTIALMAAFADGRQDGREREHVRRIAESLSREAGADFIPLYQDVLLRRVKLEDAVAALDAPALRQLAFETAVGVCDADGHHGAEETAFLDRLAALLGLDAGRAHALVDEADALADAPVNGALPPVPADLPAPAPASAAPAAAPGPDQAELDRMILNAAILNGALELLPQSLASWAIIPLQTRLVYRIGKAHGFELDRGHITDFLATIGVGLTSQYVEQFGRKLVGGLLGKVLGKAGRAIGSAATGSAFSFASTWALGQVARRYYGGGRKLDSASLKQMFAGLVDEARDLQTRYRPQIEERARTLDLQQLTAQLRG